jgi:hypothetical protein
LTDCSRKLIAASRARLKGGGAISEHKLEQRLKQVVEFRAALMRQIDGLNFVFDA